MVITTWNKGDMAMLTKAKQKKLDKIIGELEAFQHYSYDEEGYLQQAKDILLKFQRLNEGK